MHRVFPQATQTGPEASTPIRRIRAACLLWLLTALSTVTPSVWAMSVQDFSGHVVQLDHPARRIVALTPHLVENLFTAGLEKRIVGAVRYSDYPAAAKHIPRVGGYRSLSLEAIVARRPDLVVAWAQSGSGDLVHRLRALGIPVYVDDPTDFQGIARGIRDLGRLGGTAATADAAARRFSERMRALRARYAGRSTISVFYAVARDPLITISDKSMIDAAITLCGGRNLYAHESASAPRVSVESLIARDPQAIVAARPGGHDDGWEAGWQRWPSVTAVAGHHFVTVPRSAMSRPTVRMAGATATLCQGLDQVRRAIANSDQNTARPASAE